MPIRLRFLLIFILGLGALFMTQRFFMSRVMEAAFLNIEKDEAEEAILRIEQAIQTELAYIEAKSVDWGVWDPAYFFVLGKNKDFIKNNFPNPHLVLRNLNLNLVLFLDHQNKIAFSSYDEKLDDEQVMSVPEDLVERFRKTIDPSRRTRGIISSPAGVFAYASIPILKGNAEGPPMGQVLFAEKVGEALRKKIEGTTQLNLQFLEHLSEKTEFESTNSSGTGFTQIEFYDKDKLAIEKNLLDVFGQTVLRVRATLPRKIYSTYLETSRMISWGLLIASLLIALAIFYFMSSQVFVPIRKLIEWQKQVSDEGTWKVKRFTQRNKAWKMPKGILVDEIDELIQSSNFLLDKIEESSSLIEKQALSLVNSEKYKSLGEMSAGIAHEINNPLMIIVALAGKVQMLLRKANLEEKMQKDFSETLQKMELTVNRVKKIIDGLLRFARDASHDPFSETDCQLPIEDGIELIRERMSMQQVELWTNIEKGLLINARPGQLTQVIYNLLSNSIDEISGKVKPWIQIRCEKVGPKARIEILDSGPGIPEAIRNKIFNPFFTTKELGKGTGLGLSISVGIIEDHGGHFFLDSQCKNTCFVIELPLKEISDQKKS